MKKPAPTNTKTQTAKGMPDRVHDVAAVGNPLNSKSKWSAVQRVRLPHKVGLPLGSGRRTFHGRC
jgi:hypothetical protein